MDLLHLCRNSGCLLLGLLLVCCDDLSDLLPAMDPDASVREIELLVRLKSDWRAVFTYDEYSELLRELARERYTVLPMDSFRITYDSSRILVAMRHDIDCHPFKALEMAEIENAFGLRSTFYILHSAEYYGTCAVAPFVRFLAMSCSYRQLADMAGEIGIHNDLVTMMMQYDIEPLTFQLEEINYYAALDIPIYGSSAHGSAELQDLNLSNRMIYSDFSEYGTFDYGKKIHEYGRYSLEEFGLVYEAYALDYNRYLSDSGGRWFISEDIGPGHHGQLKDVILALQSSEPGDRVQVLTHPVWWGKE
ncbi:MAG: hypothetical protein JSW54_12105 [Fidelibacterota bacterium]|nr:MAG: hypothetical protein JSW54_12105 [Candidatus Neomarinimicrobiota bacterium]